MSSHNLIRIFLLLLTLSLSFMVARATPEGINALRFEGPLDYTFSILLEEQPVVTFCDDYIVVTTHMSAVSIPSSLVTKFTYVYDENTTSINNASLLGSVFSLDGSCLCVTNFTPSTVVQVYRTDGVLVSSATTDSCGNVSLFVPEDKNAVYVVKTSTVTFKIRKK